MQDYSSAMRLLEQRLEEVEAAAAQREAEELLAVAWTFLCLSAAAVVLLLAACGWQRSLLALAALAVVIRLWLSKFSGGVPSESSWVASEVQLSSCWHQKSLLRFANFTRLFMFRQLRALWLCVGRPTARCISQEILDDTAVSQCLSPRALRGSCPVEIHAERVGGEATLRGGCQAFLECEVQAMALPSDPRVQGLANRMSMCC